MHHRDAMDWLRRESGHGHGSCALIQTGCILIMTQPGYPPGIHGRRGRRPDRRGGSGSVTRILARRCH